MNQDTIQKLLEQLESLSVAELIELTSAIKIKFNIQDISIGSSSSSTSDSSQGASTKKVTLAGIDTANRLPGIKFLREQLGISLTDAKKVVDTLPYILKEGISDTDATSLAALYKEAGFIVNIE